MGKKASTLGTFVADFDCYFVSFFVTFLEEVTGPESGMTVKVPSYVGGPSKHTTLLPKKIATLLTSSLESLKHVHVELTNERMIKNKIIYIDIQMKIKNVKIR